MATKTVYPVEGRFLMGVPHVEHDCDDPHCVKSGAFTDTKPKKETAPESPDTKPKE